MEKKRMERRKRVREIKKKLKGERAKGLMK